MRQLGKITNWKDEQGFGFISPMNGGNIAFVHIKAFSKRSRRPAIGDKVSYELAVDEHGRLRADNVRLNTARKASLISYLRGLGLILFSSFILVSALLQQIHLIIPILYLLMSTATFVLYAKDKSAALNNYWRIPEYTLHICSLAFGWPGALLAQIKLRHKCKKISFQIDFCLTVIINCGVLNWLYSKNGSIFVNTLIDLATNTYQLLKL
ncbi:MAG: cold shock and DUF1294 domain-containing protein [Methylococcaceae bacterium]|jgi:uncharacterized membrane protein YsdA (DUF1294 family)/cold shock CspA family protein